MRTTSSNNIVPISRAAISVLVENFQKKQRVQELVRELAKKLAMEQTKKNLPKAQAKVEFIQFRFLIYSFFVKSISRKLHCL